jgi:hypothetical protein
MKENDQSPIFVTFFIQTVFIKEQRDSQVRLFPSWMIHRSNSLHF